MDLDRSAIPISSSESADRLLAGEGYLNLDHRTKRMEVLQDASAQVQQQKKDGEFERIMMPRGYHEKVLHSRLGPLMVDFRGRYVEASTSHQMHT